MDIIHYSRIVPSYKADDLFRKMELHARFQLSKEYGLNPATPDYSLVSKLIKNQATRIIEVLGNRIEDKKILDLGCGSRLSSDRKLALFEPWLCRFLFACSIDITGVDIAPQENELFNSYQADLRQETPIFIAKYDIANAFFLFNSPTLAQDLGNLELYTIGIWRPSHMLKRRVMKNVSSVLKPEGHMIYY